MITNCYLSYEKYKAIKELSDRKELNGEVFVKGANPYVLADNSDLQNLSYLDGSNERVHQELCRLSLVDNLTNEFEWHYWMVVTFGFHPLRSEVENILRTAHHRFDQWLRTNNKLSFMSVEQRSKWVCLPERGDDGHLHYNCFLQLNIAPEVKTYGSEWNTIRVALNTTFDAVGKANNKRIDFKVYEQRRNKDRLKQSIYSTKEMTQRYIDEHPNDDHFASFIRSWSDWQIQPLTKRSGKKIETIDDSSGTLEQFF